MPFLQLCSVSSSAQHRERDPIYKIRIHNKKRSKGPENRLSAMAGLKNVAAVPLLPLLLLLPLTTLPSMASAARWQLRSRASFAALRVREVPLPGGITSDPPPPSAVGFSVLRLVPGGPNSATSDPPPPPPPSPSQAVDTSSHADLLPAGEEGF